MESEQHHDGASTTEGTAETLPMPHDSMVTVRLSEPSALPALTVDTNVQQNAERESAISNDSIKTEEETTSVQTPDITLDDVQEEQEEQEESPRITMMDPNGNEVESPMEPESARESRRGSDSTEASEAEEVNWEELEKTEENEPRNESSDDVSPPN
jgi:hypothetical protein